MQPLYDLDKIKFGTDSGAWERAVNLYEKGKVVDFKEFFDGYAALVLGTESYEVSVAANHYDRGSCNCYLGQKEVLCKHMVAVAIYAIKRGKPFTKDEKLRVSEPVCGGLSGKLTPEELAKTKKAITDAAKYIKAYNGPSRTWFAYQNSLSEGCNRLSKIISDFPVGLQSADLTIKLLLRLDKKLRKGGVDDSDGTVGNFMGQTVGVLEKYAKIDPNCIKSFKKLCDIETCFGWEETLAKIYSKSLP